mmetsp:Transcript_4142/g.15253  ORF Transcript_4142/g.15253 Transcript_4142/m.15253 type:complete len:253 (+) Transcript_4142:1691-2449(+)
MICENHAVPSLVAAMFTYQRAEELRELLLPCREAIFLQLEALLRRQALDLDRVAVHRHAEHVCKMGIVLEGGHLVRLQQLRTSWDRPGGLQQEDLRPGVVPPPRVDVTLQRRVAHVRQRYRHGLPLHPSPPRPQHDPVRPRYVRDVAVPKFLPRDGPVNVGLPVSFLYAPLRPPDLVHRRQHRACLQHDIVGVHGVEARELHGTRKDLQVGEPLGPSPARELLPELDGQQHIGGLLQLEDWKREISGVNVLS